MGPRGLPADIAFDIACVVDGIEHSVGWLAGRPGTPCTSSHDFLRAGEVGPKIETVDVILRPNPAHLDAGAAPWSDEIVFEDGRVIGSELQ